MNPLAVILLLATGIGMITAGRKAAMACFLIGCCYMTAGEGVQIAGLNMPVFRLLLVAGMIRLIKDGQGVSGGVNLMDKVMFGWGCWVIFSSFFHDWAPGSGPKFAIGAVFNAIAFYLLLRSYCRDISDLYELFGLICWILAPVAVLMVIEQTLHRNLFSVFGGVPEVPDFRNGKYRAQGPFSHAILAGTVAAGCIPLVLTIWRRNRFLSIIGLCSCLLMVGASASSGPIMSTLFGVAAILLWKRKSLVNLMVKSAVPIYILLALVMERPPYYLISKIDLTGASTGWHRSFLIDQTIKHLDEWWLFGTDRTRHWMPSQGRISENHTDITNQYIAYGVNSGLLGMFLVIVMMVMAFRVVSVLIRTEGLNDQDKFLFWCIGASLFAHASSAISVAYFGQALFFFWLPIICLASFYRREDLIEQDETDVEEFGEEQGPGLRTMYSTSPG